MIESTFKMEASEELIHPGHLYSTQKNSRGEISQITGMLPTDGRRRKETNPENVGEYWRKLLKRAK